MEDMRKVFAQKWTKKSPYKKNGPRKAQAVLFFGSWQNRTLSPDHQWDVAGWIGGAYLNEVSTW
jgi:hypothetical protein